MLKFPSWYIKSGKTAPILDDGLARVFEKFERVALKEIENKLGDSAGEIHLFSEIKNLRKRNDIVVTKTDKTGKLCDIPVDIYKTRLVEMLFENYEEVSEMNLKKIFEEIWRNLLGFLDGYPEYVRKFLRESMKDSYLPEFYLLHKDHKAELFKMRPICSWSGYGLLQLANFIDKELLRKRVYPQMRKSLPANIILAKDSGEVARFLRDTVTEEKELVCCTLDVNNLYPNVLWERLEKVLKQILRGFDGGLLADLVMKIVRANFVSCKDGKFHQRSGIPMGCPLSVTLANLYLYVLDLEAGKFLEKEERYVRFLDDIFVMLKRAKIDGLVRRLNGCVPAITLVEGSRGKIVNFLDLTIVLGTQKIDFGLFIKSLKGNVMIPFASQHPKCVFKGIFLGEVARRKRLCSNFEMFKICIRRLWYDCLEVGYPEYLLVRWYDEWKRKGLLDKKESIGEGKEVIFLPLTYRKEYDGLGIEKIFADFFPGKKLIISYKVEANLMRRLGKERYLKNFEILEAFREKEWNSCMGGCNMPEYE